MKSVVSAIAASILTAFAFAPLSLAGPISGTMATTALAPSTQIAPTRETPIVLAQLSPEIGLGSQDAAGNHNESGDSTDQDSAAQSDDQGNGDAQNGDADNGDSDPNAQNADSADNADNSDSANAENGDSGNVQSDSGDASQNADNSAMR
jgi:hypothetical protein